MAKNNVSRRSKKSKRRKEQPARATLSDKASPDTVPSSVEERFSQIMEGPLSQAHDIGEADIVVGIPFYNETDTLPHVIKTAAKGLAKFFPNSTSVIVTAGSPAGRKALRAVEETPIKEKIDLKRITFLMDDDLLDGKGWCIRAIIELTEKLGADLILLEADLKSRKRESETEGLVAGWIPLLLDPIKQGKMDMVVSRFDLHYADLLTSAEFKYPLLSAIYDCPVHNVMGGLRGMHYGLVRKCARAIRRAWHDGIAGYGIDTWLITTAATSGARFCEVNLGVKIRTHSGGKSELVFRQGAKTLFDQIVEDYGWWGQVGMIRNSPLLSPMPIFGERKPHHPDPVEVAPEILIGKYKEGFNQFNSLYRNIFPHEVFVQLESLAESEGETFKFPSNLWTDVVYGFLLAYAFRKEFTRDDLFDSLVPLRDGFTGSSMQNILILKKNLVASVPEFSDHLISIEAESQIGELTDHLLRKKPAFLAQWEEESEALKSPVPQVTYREFIPGVPLIVPTQLKGPSGERADANGIYNMIFAHQKAEFEKLVYERLGAPRSATSTEISQMIKDFLRSVESALLPDSDFSTVKGTEKAVQQIFDYFPHSEAFSLTLEMATWLLERNPPLALLTKLGFTTIKQALKEYDARDVLALASWVEEREYHEDLWALIKRNIRSEHFTPCPIRFLTVSDQDFPALVEMRDSSDLDKLGSGILVSNLHKGMGGEFPKLRYLTTIAKNIVEAERFGQVWQQFAADRKDFGRKVIDSIEGHWGREPLSVHNIFEDSIHRTLANRLREMGDRIAADGNGNGEVADQLRAIADSYHLALTLPDGAFVTCSAWSWASYSFHGGRASPSPLSIQVERDWTTREFLVRYYEAVGGTEAEVEEWVIELMGQGRASENLATILLGTEEGSENVVPRRTYGPQIEPLLAGNVHRFPQNPILEPIKEHAWESSYVLNAGAIWINDKVYLIYRAFGEDKISRLGLAVSEGGFKFTERLDSPIFKPQNKNEVRGCEDPRLIVMGDRIYMTYTAYDGVVAQIALASMHVEDFVDHQWNKWQRHGMVFPGFTDKDAALFPEQFDGKYAMLHRVDPHIWITYSTHLRCPWSRKQHEILAGSTYGLMWDGRKIGAGAQPIKTTYGWLLITHGVDYAHVYRLGVMVLDLANPSKLIYRSPNWVLEPEDKWEMGKDEQSWVPHVVFTCGALPKDNRKEILDADDELIIYYGAADTVMCAGTALIGELIPEEIRESP